MKSKKQPESEIFTTNITAEFRPIIKQYWDDFDAVLQEYNDPLYGTTNSDIDERSINLIKRLKQLPSWRSNLFILYIHFKKPRILAQKLRVKYPTLTVYLTQIKKELQC